MKKITIIHAAVCAMLTAGFSQAGNLTIDGELSVASNSVRLLQGTNVAVGVRANTAGSLQRVITSGPLAATNTIWDAGNDGSGSGLDADKLDGLDSTNLWKTGGNAGTQPGQFIGTTDNKPLEFRANNAVGLRIEPASIPNVIGGGNLNTVHSNTYGSAIIGGSRNMVLSNALYSAILGGYSNVVGEGAQFSVAAGRRAKANHPGSFVWADRANADLLTTAPDQFLIRASGGVGIGTNNTAGSALTVAGQVVIQGPLVVSEPAGDIPMGTFTAGKP